MRFIREFIEAVRSFFAAFPFIRRNKLWGYFMIPAICNLVILLFIGYLAFIYSGSLIDYLSGLWGIDAEETWSAILQFFLALIIRAIVVLIYFKIYRYLVLILLAPVLVLMAEKIHTISTGEKIPFSFKQLISDAIRGAKIAAYNFLREISLTICILILALLIPILSPFAPFLIFFIESYYYGFSMIDYFNELKRLDAQQSRKMIWDHKGLAMGNGAMFNLLLLIPVIGAMTAPMIALTGAHLALSAQNDLSD